MSLSFGYVEVRSESCVVTWMVAHFIFGLRNDETVNSFHAAFDVHNANKKLHSLSLTVSKDH